MEYLRPDLLTVRRISRADRSASFLIQSRRRDYGQVLSPQELFHMFPLPWTRKDGSQARVTIFQLPRQFAGKTF